jgi:hypothetical protein
MNWKPVVVVALLLIGVGVMLETLVAAGGRIIDIGAAVFALATWIVPPLRLAMAKKRRSSLASVGLTMHIVVLAACLSAIGLLLALLTLVFASASEWAWPAMLVIAALGNGHWFACCRSPLSTGRVPQSRLARAHRLYRH